MTRRRVGSAAPPTSPPDQRHPFERLRAELEEFRDMLVEASYERGDAGSALHEGREYWFETGSEPGESDRNS